MAAMMRVGAGTLREAFSPDLLEEIRIMAEAAQAQLTESFSPAQRQRPSFAGLLARILSGR